MWSRGGAIPWSQDASVQRLRTGHGQGRERRDQCTPERCASPVAGNPWSMRTWIRTDPGSENRGWHEQYADDCPVMCISPNGIHAG